MYECYPLGQVLEGATEVLARPGLLQGREVPRGRGQSGQDGGQVQQPPAQRGHGVCEAGGAGIPKEELKV